MILTLMTTGRGKDSTGGELFVGSQFECFTCEDEIRDKKVRGETAIPEGVYEIKLRTEGGMHARYSERYSFHKGMLWLQGVPNFEWVYIHTGNDDDDTEGCILVGQRPTAPSPGEFGVSHSRLAYETLYKKVIAAFERGDRVFIAVRR